MIEIRGAREQNLKDIDLDLPLGSLIAVTGVSGSGKSSLAFGTILAESQHRLYETLSPYTRRLVRQLPRPDVRTIRNLPPAVGLAQTSAASGVGSTIATHIGASLTLRLLFSRFGTYLDGATKLEASAFSPRSAEGACLRCGGSGAERLVFEEDIVPDPALSIREGAVRAWPGAWHGKNLRDIVDALGHDVDAPWQDLPAATREWILFTDDRPVVTVVPARGPHTVQGPYEGTFVSVRAHLLGTIARTKSAALRKRAESFTRPRACPTCDGSGLGPKPRSVRYLSLGIRKFEQMRLEQLTKLLGRPDPPPTQPSQPDRPDYGGLDVGEKELRTELAQRVDQLVKLGLGHLSLDRRLGTLSAGEHQKVRIAAVLHAPLFGVLYVFDEPSAGMHPEEVLGIRDLLTTAVSAGNTVIAIDHHRSIIEAADWVVELGPSSGTGGGIVMSNRPAPAAPATNAREHTTIRTGLERPSWNANAPTGADVIVTDALTVNNLALSGVRLPSRHLIGIAGVSGSGKTSLLTALQLDDRCHAAGRVLAVTSAPIGNTVRSTVSTYTGVMDSLRDLFTETAGAHGRDLTPSHFSFNRPEGQCPDCAGCGMVKIDMVFLPDATRPCSRCGGDRYNDDVLAIRYQGRTIADVLALTVDEAIEFLGPDSACRPTLTAVTDVGLGYVSLGQRAGELSGGESQRLRLAFELGQRPRGHRIYLLDEPGRGLHPADVQVLVDVLHRLVATGHTVVFADQTRSLLNEAAWIIELGPAAGDAGGTIIAAGSPDSLRSNSASRIGAHLSIP